MALDPKDLQEITKIVAGELAPVMSRLQEGDRRFEEHTRKLREHDRMLNGHPEHPEAGGGLKLEVHDLKERAKFWSRLGWVMVGCIATSAVTGAATAAIYLIRQIH